MHFFNSQSLIGEVRAPGDKSISHRALILGALAEGTTHISGLLTGEDVFRTAGCLAALGVDLKVNGDGEAMVTGKGVGNFNTPDVLLHCGNSGTTARLLLGAMASSDMTATFAGDASLSKRPMGRVVYPLRDMGMTFGAFRADPTRECLLPFQAMGNKDLVGIYHKMNRPSAQVKTALILAGLGAAKNTVICETEQSRNHTENMLFDFGVELTYVGHGHSRSIIVPAKTQPKGCKHFVVPGDPSSAAFPLVAALITPGSDVTVRGVMMNHFRDGLYKLLSEMGADIHRVQTGYRHGEFVGDVRCRFSHLKGIYVPASRAVTMIDEFPIFFIAAAQAKGDTVMTGLSELRVKESDRLAVMIENLGMMGVPMTHSGDDLTIHGLGSQRFVGGFTAKVEMDHRIAMSMAVAAQFATDPIDVDVHPVATSYPGFVQMLESLYG